MSDNVMGVEMRQGKKFVYCDEYSMRHRDVGDSIPQQEFLGYRPDLLDSSRYSWGAVKLPKGKSWNNDAVINYRTKEGKDIRVFHDKGYAFSSIMLYDNEPDLYIKFIPSKGKNFEYRVLKPYHPAVCLMFKQKALYLTIKNYSLLSAFQVINDFRSPVTGDSLGRHFEEAILTFWQSHRLPLM